MSCPRSTRRLSTTSANRSEAQILSGDGTGQNLLGIRNRSGVQTHERGEDTVADALFKAIQKVQTATRLLRLTA